MSYIWLPPLIYHKSCIYTFHNTFVILLYTFNKLVNSRIKFFIKKTVKKFISLHLFSISQLQLFWRRRFRKRIINIRIVLSRWPLITSPQRNIFTWLRLNNMILPDTLHHIKLIQFTMTHSLLNHLPLLKKILLSLLILPYIIQKLQQT